VPEELAASMLGAGVVASVHDREHTVSMPTAELSGAGTGERRRRGRSPARRMRWPPWPSPTGASARSGCRPWTTASRMRVVLPWAAVSLLLRTSRPALARSVGPSVSTWPICDPAHTLIARAASGSTATTLSAASHESISLPTTESKGLYAGDSTGGIGAPGLGE
jgi:hypothetical protein